MNERLERKLDMIAYCPPRSFAYDPHERTFRVGEELVALEDYSSFSPGPAEQIDLAAAQKLVAESHLVLNVFDNPCQMPSMYNWLVSLDESKAREVKETVVDTMIDAYGITAKHTQVKLEKGALWGFDMEFIRPGHPTLSVLGNCACLGVDLYGNMFGQYDWEEGFSEYTFHNIDWPAQRVALMAGAGVLATACEIELKG